MDKGWKKILCIAGLLVIPFIASAFSYLLGGLMFIACPVIAFVLICRWCIPPKKRKHGPRHAAGNARPAKAVQAQPIQKAQDDDICTLDMQRKGFFYQQETGNVKYFHTDVGVYVPDLVALCSEPEALPLHPVVFFQEPNNQYDNRAVAVCQSQGPIGYLYRGKNQDMANYWLDNGKKVIGYISYFDPTRPDANKNGLKIDIAFY